VGGGGGGARLLSGGAGPGLPLDHQLRLVIDIGGGSTECIIGIDDQPKRRESLQIGCVSLTQQFFSSGKISRAILRKARLHCGERLAEHVHAFRRLGWQYVVGTSGTAKALLALVNANFGHTAITREGLEQLEQLCLSAGHVDALADLPGLRADRQPVIVGGLAAMQAVFDEFGIEAMGYCDSALREGILYDLLGRESGSDQREITISHLVERYRMDDSHGRQVAEVACALLAELKGSRTQVNVQLATEVSETGKSDEKAAVAAILLCGTEPKLGTVSRLLSWRPLVALGDRSYAVYLLHWPLFVLYLTATQQRTFDLQTGAVLILASLVAAAAMTRCVDRPAQVFPRSGRRLGVQAAMVTVSLVVGGIPLGVAGGAIAYQRHMEISQQVQAGIDPDHPGALAVLNGQASDWTKPPVPGPLSVTTEWATLAGVKCADDLAALIDSENSSCRRLPSVSDTALKAVVVGDSHAAQNVIPTMRLLHETDDWDITAYLKGGCSFGLPEYYKDSCRERNNVVLEQLERNPPDVVVLQTTETSKDSSIELLRPGIKKIVEQLTEEGITVIGFRDNPRSEKSLYECANAVGPQTLVGGCVFPKENAMAAEDPAKFLEENPLFHQIDASDMLCPDGVCGTIIGDVFVYMDDNHISSTYSRTMAPELAARIEAAMDPADSGRE